MILHFIPMRVAMVRYGRNSRKKVYRLELMIKLIKINNVVKKSAKRDNSFFGKIGILQYYFFEGTSPPTLSQ